MHFKISLTRDFKKSEDLIPDGPGKCALFYANLLLGEVEWGGMVGKAAVLEDYFAANQQHHLETQGIHPLKAAPHLFLVDAYSRTAITAAVAQYFGAITTGADVEELYLKTQLLFSDADFWDHYPPRFDMQHPALPYRVEISGIQTVHNETIAWADVPNPWVLTAANRLLISLHFHDETKVVWLECMPEQSLYAWMDGLPRHSMVKPGHWGFAQMTKSDIEEEVQRWYDHFEGSSKEEILLRWACMAHVPDLERLLATPLSAGGPYTLDPAGIKND